MRPQVLFGEMRCGGCRIEWWATWSTATQFLICHECGSGQVVPQGIQTPVERTYAVDGYAWAIQRRQALKVLN